MGDLIINTLTQTKSNNTVNHLTNIRDLFALSNLSKHQKTFTKSMMCGTSLDIQTNQEVSIIPVLLQQV